MSRIFNLEARPGSCLPRATLRAAWGTMSVDGYERHPGGKGYNHSAAIAKAHGTVVHIGACPTADLAAFQVVPAPTLAWHIEPSAQPAGHAIIQVDTHGENQILLFPVPIEVTQHHLDTLVAGPNAPAPGDWFLAQNETNLVKEAPQWAKSAGLRTAYVAAPLMLRRLNKSCPTSMPWPQMQSGTTTAGQHGPPDRSAWYRSCRRPKGGDGVSLWRTTGLTALHSPSTKL